MFLQAHHEYPFPQSLGIRVTPTTGSIVHGLVYEIVQRMAQLWKSCGYH